MVVDEKLAICQNSHDLLFCRIMCVQFSGIVLCASIKTRMLMLRLPWKRSCDALLLLCFICLCSKKFKKPSDQKLETWMITIGEYSHTILPQGWLEQEFLPGISVFHWHSAVITERNLLLRRKRSEFLYQQSSMGDGKILGNIGNHKLKPE